MATTTDFTCNKDARLARRESDNYDTGAGTGAGLAYGLYEGYRYRSVLGFSINMAGWTSIVSATFHYKSSNQINIAFGSDPTMLIQRCTTAWSEGSASALSASNAVIYPGPNAPTTNNVEEDAPTTENTWGSADITAMMRDVLGGAPFTGLMLKGSTNTSVESDSATNVGEIYSRESGSGTPYIRIVYETNRAPTPPAVTSTDISAGLSGSTTPSFSIALADLDAGELLDYNWQIDNNADFSSPIQDVYVASQVPSGTNVTVAPAALTRGLTYYFRARVSDNTVWGGWSTLQFKVASLPVLTVSEPSASGRLARLTYDAGSGWASPRMVVNWDMTCPDGGSQATWRVEVFNDSGGALGTSFNDSTPVNDTQSSRIVPATLIEGNYYHVRVTATCSHGLSIVTGPFRVRTRWGVVTHKYDMGVTPISSLALTTLDVTDETKAGSGRVVMEYATTTGAAPGAYAGTIGGAGLARYFWYRAWLLTWGTSPAISPTLNALTITYSTATIVPEKWEFTNPALSSSDVSSFVYGTKSLRLNGNGGYVWASQQIAVATDTLYMLSGRVQTLGNAGAYLDLATAHAGTSLIASPIQPAGVEFEHPASRLFPVEADDGDPATAPRPKPWFSGENTSVWVRCLVSGPVGTTAWFDAIKLEASPIVTPWAPGYVANAVVLDAGGISVDAKGGGIFRLRGSNGGVRDTVELGASGLVLGGDTPVTSPAAGVLQVSSLYVNGILRLATDVWHLSADGKSRVYYMSNGRTFYGSANGHEFRGSTDQSLAYVEDSGNFNAIGGIFENSTRLIQPAGLRIHRGTTNVTTTAGGGSSAVAFSPAFSGAPVVVCNLGSTAGPSALKMVRATGVGVSGCTLSLLTTDAANPITAGTVLAVDWLAIGPA